MNTAQLNIIIEKFAKISQQEYNVFDLREKFGEELEYSPQEVDKFIDHLTEKAHNINVSFLRNTIYPDNLEDILQKANFPILLFCKKDDKTYHPILCHQDDYGTRGYNDICTGTWEVGIPPKQWLQNMLVEEDPADKSIEGKVIFLTAFPLEYISKDYYSKAEGELKLTPYQRLWRLLRAEKQEIFYLYIYAFIVGIVSLTLPLGIQATVSQISGGMFFSSVIVLISLVVLGVILGGALQVMQISLVEVIRQRIFAKAAFELAYRITRIKKEAIHHDYPPELMNRFFDIVTIQKGLPKLFVDISGAIIQILFGLILLSLYHAYFLIFSIVVVVVISMILYITTPAGLRNAIYASKYKYKVVYWLEELARTLDAFKQAGTTHLPLQKMDELVNKYLYHRKSYFKVLVTQFFNVVAFKTLVTGGTLVIGTTLVVDRDITLGQFVAAEVIIILVVGSVEKLIISMETVYDLLVGVDKLAHLTDLPLERNDGFRMPLLQHSEGLELHVKNLKYKFEGNTDYTLKGVDFDIKAGEVVCIAGANDSGKHTLMKILLGSLEDFEGNIVVNGFSLRDLNLDTIRDHINKHLNLEEIFDGSILENITMGRAQIHYTDVMWAIEHVGLAEYIGSLPEGLATHIGATGRKLSGSIVAKIILARSVSSKPKLLIINDFSEHIQKTEKLKIMSFLREKSNGWTLIILSVDDDALLFASADKIIIMSDGKVVAQGNYEELLGNKTFQKFVMNK